MAGGGGGEGVAMLLSHGVSNDAHLWDDSAPTVGDLSSMSPAPPADNVGTLTEFDDLVSIRSFYYSTELIFGPEFSRYEIEATVDGVPMTFSDDPAVSTMQATNGSPIRVLFQAANLDVVTGEVLNPVPRPWRQSVRSSSNQTGIASDGLNGYRFMLFIDRTLATNVTIDKLTVVYRN